MKWGDEDKKPNDKLLLACAFMEAADRCLVFICEHRRHLRWSLLPKNEGANRCPAVCPSLGSSRNWLFGGLATERCGHGQRRRSEDKRQTQPL